MKSSVTAEELNGQIRFIIAIAHPSEDEVIAQLLKIAKAFDRINSTKSKMLARMIRKSVKAAQERGGRISREMELKSLYAWASLIEMGWV